MTDEELKAKKAKEEQAEKKKEEEALETAESKNTETQKEHMIPKSRFDEVNKKATELEAENKRLTDEKKTAVDKQLAANEEWEKLAATRGEELAKAQGKADQVDSYEETLQGVLDAQVEQIPEDLRGLIPSKMSTKDQLDYIAENNTLLHKSKPFDIGAGKRGGNNNKSTDLNRQELEFARLGRMTPEEYAKYKD